MEIVTRDRHETTSKLPGFGSRVQFQSPRKTARQISGAAMSDLLSLMQGGIFFVSPTLSPGESVQTSAALSFLAAACRRFQILRCRNGKLRIPRCSKPCRQFALPETHGQLVSSSTWHALWFRDRFHPRFHRHRPPPRAGGRCRRQCLSGSRAWRPWAPFRNQGAPTCFAAA